jgi:hypothetical protein
MKYFILLLLLFSPSISPAQSPVIPKSSQLAIGPIDDLTLLFSQLILGDDIFVTIEDVEREEALWNLKQIDTLEINTELAKHFYNCSDVELNELYFSCSQVYSQSVGSFFQYNQFTYFDSTNLIELGFTNNTNGPNQASICSPNKLIYQFPLEYGTTYSSSYSCNPDTLVSGFQESEEGERSCEVDAWGTLILPIGTFSNVLRLKVVETGTIYSYSNGSLFRNDSITRTTYEYLDANSPVALAVFTKTEFGQNPATYKGEYITAGLPTGIKDKENIYKGLRVYPNPVNSKLNIELPTTNTKVAIYNSVGITIEETIVTGTHHEFDVSNYTRGIYFIKANNTVVKFIR